jgi:hypothetical protein
MGELFIHVVVAYRGEEEIMIPEGGIEGKGKEQPTKGKGRKATAVAHQKK